MPFDDLGKSIESMVTLDQKQHQQNRQEQDQIENDDHHISKLNSNDEFQKNCRNLKTLNGIRKNNEEIIEEVEEEEEELEIKEIKKKEENEENVVNSDDYYLDIESYDESTASSDVEEDLEENVLRDRGWISEIPSASPQSLCEIGTGNGVALPTVEAPCFGDVCVKNSNNVHLGSKTFYKGPVTIKQFVYSNSEFKKDEELGDDEKRDSVPSQNISQTSDVPLNSEFVKGDFFFKFASSIFKISKKKIS